MSVAVGEGAGEGVMDGTTVTAAVEVGTGVLDAKGVTGSAVGGELLAGAAQALVNIAIHKIAAVVSFTLNLAEMVTNYIQ
jgi:hypothetical protein